MVSLYNNDIDFGYAWYNDAKSKITSGILVTGKGHPRTNHLLGFQLHQNDNQSKIYYDSTNKYIYISDEFGVRKYPIQGITDRVSTKRPSTSIIGYEVYDKTLQKPIWWDGEEWNDKMSKFVPIPTSATSVGNIGDWSADVNYMYVCHATNTWKRVAIASW